MNRSKGADAPASRIRSVVLCGAGAVGSTYAARLHELASVSLSIVARGERRIRLEREGLTVNGRSFHPRCVAPGEIEDPADLVLVAVKQHHLPDAIEDLRAFVGEATIVISLLNGITSETILGRSFGASRVLTAFTLGNDVVREGRHTRFSSMGKLVFGASSNDRSDPRVVAVQDLLEQAGIPSVVPDDILREQWWKFVMNVGVNQVSAVLRATYRAFSEIAEVRDLCRLASLEAIAVAQAERIRLTPDDVERIFPVLATLAPDGKTSMLQDVEAHRKTEVEIFGDTVVELGARHGIATPVNALLATEIRALEHMAGIGGDAAIRQLQR